MSIAETVLTQLGGNRFIAMTGAKNFLALPDGLLFQLPGGGGRIKDGINNVLVKLHANDLYTLSFNRRRGRVLKEVARVTDVYFDQLQPMFTKYTGLYTTMGRLAA